MKGIFLKIYLFKGNNPKKLQDQPSKACMLRYKYIGIKNIIHMWKYILYITKEQNKTQTPSKREPLQQTP
ncbi:hypothetical protein PRUPE_7G082500 [Prunus persica]|uniref:Uncharacterized protein n=1 Tax=Prunus persica TaxID=3760 RepID=A0A251N8G8_PRUPE|nr:hypothetical protein PRUPE_7G082500 [Prunus persica]